MAAIVSESNVYSQSRRGGKSPASRNELQGGLSGRGQAFVDIKIRVAWEFIHGRKTVNKLFRKHMVHSVHGRPRRVPGAWGKYAARREGEGETKMGAAYFAHFFPPANLGVSTRMCSIVTQRHHISFARPLNSPLTPLFASCYNAKIFVSFREMHFSHIHHPAFWHFNFG